MSLYIVIHENFITVDRPTHIAINKTNALQCYYFNTRIAYSRYLSHILEKCIINVSDVNLEKIPIDVLLRNKALVIHVEV